MRDSPEIAEAKRQERAARRLDVLGITSLEGAKVIIDAQVLITINEESGPQYTILDPNISLDSRLIDQLPKEEAPKRHDRMARSLGRLRGYNRIGNQI